jgi:hypothetical protein
LEAPTNYKPLFKNTLFCSVLQPGTSDVTLFDVIERWFEDLFTGLFASSRRMAEIRIYKRSAEKKVNKRDIMLPSFGTAGEIVNDMAISVINAATVWKYQ